MSFLLIPFLLIELFLSLKTGEIIGFWWSVVWIMASFSLGMTLLRKSTDTIMNNMQSVRLGKLDIKNFQNVSTAYFMAALLLMIPGVFSDLLGIVALVYALYLQFVAKITPEHTTHFKKQGENDVIDVEIIDEYNRTHEHS